MTYFVFVTLGVRVPDHCMDGARDLKDDLTGGAPRNLVELGPEDHTGHFDDLGYWNSEWMEEHGMPVQEALKRLGRALRRMRRDGITKPYKPQMSEDEVDRDDREDYSWEEGKMPMLPGIRGGWVYNPELRPLEERKSILLRHLRSFRRCLWKFNTPRFWVCSRQDGNCCWKFDMPWKERDELSRQIHEKTHDTDAEADAFFPRRVGMHALCVPNVAYPGAHLSSWPRLSAHPVLRKLSTKENY